MLEAAIEALDAAMEVLLAGRGAWRVVGWR